MPEIQPSQTTQSEIAELEQMLAQKRALLIQQHAAGEINEVPHPKELLRDAIKEKLAPTPGTPVPIPPPPPLPQPTASVPPPPQSPIPPLPPSHATDELRSRVQELVSIAFAKSLNAAIETAKATQNPALIDAFHDVMVDQLYDHLVQNGKLEKLA